MEVNPRSVVAIGHWLADGTWIVSVDVFDRSVVVRWFRPRRDVPLAQRGGVPPSAEAEYELEREGQWRPDHRLGPVDWELRDEAGTPYELVHSAAFGGDDADVGYVTFEPAPGRGTIRGELRADGVEIDLPLHLV